MKKVRSAVLLFMVMLFAAAPFVQASPYTMLETLPKKIGKFWGAETQESPNGASVRFERAGTHFSVDILDMLRDQGEAAYARQIMVVKDATVRAMIDEGLSVLVDTELEMSVGREKTTKVFFTQLAPPRFPRVITEFYFAQVGGYLCRIWVIRDGGFADKNSSEIRTAAQEIFARLTAMHQMQAL